MKRGSGVRWTEPERKIKREGNDIYERIDRTDDTGTAKCQTVVRAVCAVWHFGSGGPVWRRNPCLSDGAFSAD